ncbi:MAG TPA: tripartite tricarboxylate transporter TctB family protein [Desulfuromonadales bacterium]|nr:tripartite tricarboxylate transporter TctB family protein [Desulfuromonadales bacterium]
MAREKIGALLLLTFSIAYGVLALRIPLSFLAQQEFFTARTMPYSLAVLGIILSLLILILPTADPKGKHTLKQETRGMEWNKAILLVVAMVFYGLTMKWLGFILASILFLMAGFYILGERRLKKMALIAIPLVILLWFVMSTLLGVYIAPGEVFYRLGVL